MDRLPLDVLRVLTSSLSAQEVVRLAIVSKKSRVALEKIVEERLQNASCGIDLLPMYRRSPRIS